MFIQRSCSEGGTDDIYNTLDIQGQFSARDAKTIAVVDDDVRDFRLLKLLLGEATMPFEPLEYFKSLDDFMAKGVRTPDVVILDRYMPDSGLSETRIREIRARHRNCGVIVHTGHVTFSLRSAAAHQGAFAVVEKGCVDATSLAMLIETAAIMGPKIRMPGETLPTD